jgi:hypothetical protein
MRFNLKVSKNGFIYLFAPIFASNITTFIMNRQYWSIQLALFTFIVYSLLMFAFVRTSGLSIYQEKIHFKVFGITFQTLPFNEIECIKLTEDGMGLTTLSKNIIKIIPYKSNGKGFIYSIHNEEKFIETLNNKNIKIFHDDNLTEEKSDKLTKKVQRNRVLQILIIMILVANLISILMWDVLYNRIGVYLVFSILITNIIVSIIFLFAFKKKTQKANRNYGVYK